MSKKEFEALELKLIMFEDSDIIRTSGEDEPGKGEFGGEWD